MVNCAQKYFEIYKVYKWWHIGRVKILCCYFVYIYVPGSHKTVWGKMGCDFYGDLEDWKLGSGLLYNHKGLILHP